MKIRILVPLFAALISTVAARSQVPGQPPKDGPRPEGPMAEQLKRRIEDLRRDGKKEEAERLQRHAREIEEQRRGNPGSDQREGNRVGPPPGNPGERREHLDEAARHLHAAGIDVSPEQLEKLGQKFRGQMDSRRPGSPGKFGPAREPGFRPPMSKPTPGAPSGVDEMRSQIRSLAKQVEELRNLVQSKLGGGHSERSAQPPKEGEHRGDKPRVEQRRPNPPVPEANRQQHDGPSRPQIENKPRTESNPSRPPGNRRESNPTPGGERARSDAP